MQQLRLYGTNASDLSPLTGLTNLKELYVSGSDVMDLSPLRDLAGLEKLHLDDTGVTDLTPLTHLTGLTELWFTDTEVEDLSLAGTSGKCPPIPCEDSTGVPVCEGTCPSGLVCDYNGQSNDPCGCIPEQVPCTDSDYPVCDGFCPIGSTCQASLPSHA